jgi:hypothetical protein
MKKTPYQAEIVSVGCRCERVGKRQGDTMSASPSLQSDLKAP